MNQDIKAALANLEQVGKYTIEAEECLCGIDGRNKCKADRIHTALEAMDMIQKMHSYLIMTVNDIRSYLHSELIRAKSPQIRLGFWWFTGVEIDVLNDTCAGSDIDKMVIIPRNKKGMKELDRVIKAGTGERLEHITRSALGLLREDILIGSSSNIGEIRKLIKEGMDDIGNMDFSFYDFVCISPRSDENSVPGEKKEEVLKIIDICKQQDILVIVSNRVMEYESQNSIVHIIKELYKHYEYLDKKIAEEILFSNPIKIMQKLCDDNFANNSF